MAGGGARLVNGDAGLAGVKRKGRPADDLLRHHPVRHVVGLRHHDDRRLRRLLPNHDARQSGCRHRDALGRHSSRLANHRPHLQVRHDAPEPPAATDPRTASATSAREGARNQLRGPASPRPHA